jgi:competence protein ComGC
MKFKSGFTLAEIVLFLIIVGILLSVGYIIVKPKQAISDKTVKYKYAAIYDALNLAIYDIVKNDDTNPFLEDSSVNSFQKLCKGLSDYINTSEANCDVAPLNPSGTYMTNEELDFRTLSPQMTSLNGMNIYISPIVTDNATTPSYYHEDNPNFVLKFFMVYVDINAKENKNNPHVVKYDQSGKENPDVFAFAIIPTGEAIPIGIAEYNDKYLPTKIGYRKNHSTFYSAETYSFRKAKQLAWNYYAAENSKLYFSESISFTYNDFIKEILERNNSQLYNFTKYRLFEDNYNGETYADCAPATDSALTRYDICSLQVQTPHYSY